MVQIPRTEFTQALKAIANERGLDTKVIIETIKQAIIAAFKRDARDHGDEVVDFEYEVEIDPVSGKVKIFAYHPDKPKKKKEVTPPGFGRIAAQTAKQVIYQKIREAEKGVIMDEFTARVGTLVSGKILRFDGPDVRVDLGRTEARMPAIERIPNERLIPNQRLMFLLKEIKEGLRGKEIILSRADVEFVKKLFEREVPEVASKSVELKAIARKPGVRTKLAVFSSQSGIDPVGSCVGQKGVRVQAVTSELGGERIDVIPWSDKPEDFIKGVMAPAEIGGVELDKKKKLAKVIVPEDQLSLAIGKEGQNVKLAGQLVNWVIEVEEIKKKGKKKSKSDEKQ